MTTSTQIRRDLERLQSERDSIKTQIDNAKRLAAAEKVFADRQWLSSAESAYRVKGRLIAKLQVELSAQLKSEKPVVDQGSFERTFITLCRERYPDVHSVLVADTLRRVGA